MSPPLSCVIHEARDLVYKSYLSGMAIEYIQEKLAVDMGINCSIEEINDLIDKKNIIENIW